MLSLLNKIWFDLWNNKARTIQVVLVIALGAIGIGLVIGGRNLIAGTIADQWRQAEPPHISLSVTPTLSKDQLRALERIDGISQAEGLLNTQIEWRLPGQTEWQTALLEGRDDYEKQKMELVALISGEWPERGTMGVIRTADSLYGVSEGDTIEVRYGDTERSYQLSGTLKPVGPFPVVFLGQPVFYADRTTFFRLTGRDTYDQVKLRDSTFDWERAEAADLEVQEYFESLDVDSVGTLFPFQNRIISPDIPPAAELLNALFLILGVIGVIIVILGIFLVYNSISAIVTQQTDQIGVMKAIGARPRQVLSAYLPLVLAYGLLATVVSIPVGGLAARGLQNLFIDLLNLENPGFRFDPTAVAVQTAISLLAPMIAALFPLRSGMRITVREAINTYGLNGAIGFIDRMIVRLRKMPYALLLVIGNTFRNRRRVFFIELTLVLAGAIFMMVNGVNDAAQYTFNGKLTSIHTYQISLSFENSERAQRIEKLALSIPQVETAESWLVIPGKARSSTQKDSEVTDARISIFGIPVEPNMYAPEMIEGRWLMPGDANAAVIHQRLAGLKNWEIGDTITLTDSRGEDSVWQIVGIAFDPVANSAIFVPRARLQREMNLTGRANTLWLQTGPKDDASLTAIAADLNQVFERRKFELAPSSTFGEATITALVEQTTGGYSLIITMLVIMAVIIALVGGVGLSGVLTLNVLERRREIGVMRSIGASNWRVIGLHIGEGVLLGWLSWLIALPISIPAGYLFATKGLSAVLFNQLAYQFNPAGPLIWLFIITMLAVIASLFPARNAAKVSVRESLAYQ